MPAGRGFPEVSSDHSVGVDLDDGSRIDVETGVEVEAVISKGAAVILTLFSGPGGYGLHGDGVEFDDLRWGGR